MLTIHGVEFMGQRLGEFDTKTNFACKYYGAFYICKPQDQDTLAAVVKLQQAIDRFANLVPLYRIPDKPLGQNPISSSANGKGIDGRVGPTTSLLGNWIPTIAAELHREAGEGDPPDAIIIATRTLEETARTQTVAKYASEIADYLNDTSGRFNDLLAAVKAAKATGANADMTETSYLWNPPDMPTETDADTVTETPPDSWKPEPLIVPPEVKKALPGKKLSVGKLVLGGGAALAAVGLCVAGAMAAGKDKKPEGGLPGRGGRSPGGWM
jgi:hypothetical protein